MLPKHRHKKSKIKLCSPNYQLFDIVFHDMWHICTYYQFLQKHAIGLCTQKLMVLVFYNFVYLYFVYMDNNMSLNVIDERYGRPQQCQHYVLPSWGFVNVCILKLDL